jgi:DNA-binding NarL/FixJ family response regulator
MHILLVDDHSLLRESLAAQLAQQEGIECVIQASDADAGLYQAKEHQPDIALMDIEMPGSSAFAAAQAIREAVPQCRVIFLSGYDYDDHVERALAAGAKGFVVKADGFSVLLSAIQLVASGGTYFSESIGKRLKLEEGRMRFTLPRSQAVAALTRRERELLMHLGRGASLKEAAAVMHVSYKTADNQKTSLMRKLNIHDRVELARFAIREGLVGPA